MLECYSGRMAKRRVEEDIERLGRLAEQGPCPAVVAAVRQALGDRVGLVVAKAAKIAAELRLNEVVPDLLAAFPRLFEKPLERDPQCWAKTAIAQALVALDCRDSAPYLHGARWVQMEPVWNGREDTAGALRGACVLALAAGTDARREDVLRALVDGLTDPLQTVRLESARAIAEMGGDEAPLLLRLKARMGDREPPVTGQVFEALLQLERAGAIPFVAGFFETAAAEVQAEAALALGSSRLPEAVGALENAWSATRDPDLKEALARALSTSRQPRAIDFLLGVVRNARAADAAAALDALAIHRQSVEIWRRVREAVEEGGTAVQEQFRSLSGDTA
jgi:hypothetical protein